MSKDFKDVYSGIFDDMKKNSHNNNEFFELIKKKMDDLCVKMPTKDPVKIATNKIKNLPRYSFLLHSGTVLRVNDSVGLWIERDMILHILDQMECDLLEVQK